MSRKPKPLQILQGSAIEICAQFMFSPARGVGALPDVPFLFPLLMTIARHEKSQMGRVSSPKSSSLFLQTCFSLFRVPSF